MYFANSTLNRCGPEKVQKRFYNTHLGTKWKKKTHSDIFDGHIYRFEFFFQNNCIRDPYYIYTYTTPFEVNRLYQRSEQKARESL